MPHNDGKWDKGLIEYAYELIKSNDMEKNKSNMYNFVSKTINPLAGECKHKCKYCHPKDTLVMMSNFTQKNIQDVIVGDEIIGIQKLNNRGYYKFVKSNVIATSKRIEKVIKITTKNSKLSCTKEHPLFGSSEKRGSSFRAAHVFSPFETIKYVNNSSRGEYSKEQELGYLRGIIDGDGCVFKHYTHTKTKSIEYLGFEIVCIDDELFEKIKSLFIKHFNIELRESIKIANKNSYGGNCRMLTTRKSNDVHKFNNETVFRLTYDFAKGYIAGMIDTDGSVGALKGNIRIAQNKTVNNEKYNRIIHCLNLLNLEFTEENDIIRIHSSFEVRMKILFDFGIFHSIKSKRLLFNSTIKGSIDSEIIKIEAGNYEDVYNIQTECETFIANGFIVHNCYVKQLKSRFNALNEKYSGDVRIDEIVLKTELKAGETYFVGSCNDIFADNVSPKIKQRIIDWCNKNDQANIILQTKNPSGLFYWNDNNDYKQFFLNRHITVCTTIETDDEQLLVSISDAPLLYHRMMIGMLDCKTQVTIEPIMKMENIELFAEMLASLKVEQINIGADSGHNNLPEPTKEEVLLLISELERLGHKVHLKSNLKRIIGNLNTKGK